MNYKKFQNQIDLSTLGMGVMRLPVLAEEPGKPIDYNQAKAMIDDLMKRGINYYDTAYVYHDGESEVFLGKALEEYERESYYIADKFNWLANPDYEAQFQQQLQRLNEEYIDFYLIHAIQDQHFDAVFDSGCIEYFDEMKKQGKIKYFGFSYHGSVELMKKLVTVYHWDFIQLQLNYYDWYYGDAKELYEIVTAANIPVMVMEPVHGGMLANLCGEAEAVYKEVEPNKSVASWAMRWVLSLENVQVVLSGMSNIEQVRDNLETFDEYKPLSEEEQELVEKAVKIQRETICVACTECRYCCPECPKGLDIPMLLNAYNEAKVSGAWRLGSLKRLPEERLPAECVGCGVCTKHCPQNFEIADYMTEMKEMMDTLK